MLLDFLNTNVKTQSIKALDDLLSEVDISGFNTTLRSLLCECIIRDKNYSQLESKKFISDLKLVLDFLHSLENKDPQPLLNSPVNYTKSDLPSSAKSHQKYTR